MAEYKITYTPDGRVRNELNYKGVDFSFTMIPNEYGKKSDKRGFDHQVPNQFPNEDEEVVEALGELGFADEDQIEEILNFISSFE